MLNTSTYRYIGATWHRPAQDQEVQAEYEDEFEDIAFVRRVGYNLSIVRVYLTIKRENFSIVHVRTSNPTKEK
jgi:hypothetical protein